MLFVVDGPENEAKGDDDASQWLPPNRAYDCAYTKQQIAIKTKYRLSVTGSEKAELAMSSEHAIIKKKSPTRASQGGRLCGALPHKPCSRGRSLYHMRR